MSVNRVAINPAQPLWQPVILLPVHRHQVAVVAGEELISAIPGEHDRNLLPSHAAHIVSGQHGGVTERLFHHLCKIRQGLVKIGIEHQFVVIGTELLRHHARVF